MYRNKFFIYFILIFIISIKGFANNTLIIPATYQFDFIPQQTLKMPDGVKLSVNYWRPKAKKVDERFPIVLELLPYRKDDSHYSADYPIGAYLAQRGIGYARVDIRGTGSSDGKLPDREYSNQELADIPIIIKQLAALAWSNGKIGMQGISWSAFNAIMAAMQQPPALKGILVAHGSDDLYANDIHNIDGALHLDIFTIEIDVDNILPKPPTYILDDDYFSNRFNQKPWIFTYLHHQRDGAFWQKGRSLQTNFSAIRIPVYAYASLLDGYRDYAIHLLEHSKTPLKVAVGPQNHDWPNGSPGPTYEWRQMAVRFWQQILNDKNTGILNEPKFTVFMRDPVPANVNLKNTPGAYFTMNWPTAKQSSKLFYLGNNHELKTIADKVTTHSLIYKPSAGVGLLNWWGETTPDMRPADQNTLIYDSPILKNDFYLMGNPQIKLTVSANAPLAHFVVRLEDVNPDGSVSFITGGLKNGAQRFSRVNPQAMPLEKTFVINFPLHFTTWKFTRGHQIRLSISNAQFPMIWPTPYKMTMQLKTGNASQIILPIVMLEQQKSNLPKLEPETPAPGITDTQFSSLTPFTITHDNKGNTIATAKEGFQMKVHGDFYQSNYQVRYSVNDAYPERASFFGKGEDNVILAKAKRHINVQSITNVHSDKHYFYVKVTHRLFENNKLLRTRTWQEKIARDFE